MPKSSILDEFNSIRSRMTEISKEEGKYQPTYQQPIPNLQHDPDEPLLLVPFWRIPPGTRDLVVVITTQGKTWHSAHDFKKCGTCARIIPDNHCGCIGPEFKAWALSTTRTRHKP